MSHTTSIDLSAGPTEIRQHHVNTEVAGWTVRVWAFGSDAVTPRCVALLIESANGDREVLDFTQPGMRRAIQLASAPTQAFTEEAFNEWRDNTRRLPGVTPLDVILPSTASQR